LKISLLDYLICPGCRGALALQKFKFHEDEIEEGVLSCSNCKSVYPIIKAIPRLLPPDLLPKLVSSYEGFINKYHSAKPGSGNFIVFRSDEKIARGFKFEWEKHSNILPEHEKEFLHVLGNVLPAEEFTNKIVLDAGCGQGRFSHFAGKYGANTVISFDLGEQTLLAKKNLENQKNVHIVQASIYNPPFKAAFDIIVSIGVIHHLPDPEKGFKTLYQLLKNNGKIFIWVYGYSSIIPVIKLLRKLTLNRSIRFNRVLGFLLAIPLYSINLLYKLSKKIRYTRKIAEKIPFHMYHDRGFSNIWTICFDKINSGVAHYYHRADLQSWLDRIEDKKSGNISERYPGKSGSSWRLMVEK
jgi:SAM-dependent methyltransferase/uncharacterized protein YbaR (Trm112 family)